MVGGGGARPDTLESMKKAAKRATPNGPRRNAAKKESLEELKRRVAAKDPLMAAILKISESVPKEDWKKLPRDLSYNLDHYIYGVPKRR